VWGLSRICLGWSLRAVVWGRGESLLVAKGGRDGGAIVGSVELHDSG
jgi:hypothetical protein